MEISASLVLHKAPPHAALHDNYDCMRYEKDEKRIKIYCRH